MLNTFFFLSASWGLLVKLQHTKNPLYEPTEGQKAHFEKADWLHATTCLEILF